ncbi:MAG: Uma2 family endonuclease [Armatimonadetes bacterium]|nr:Uma2 family endonuclease [Armatimonadota bacterium]
MFIGKEHLERIGEDKIFGEVPDLVVEVVSPRVETNNQQAS